ncbi:oligopeptide/dipeptide ABC transporter, ATPase subunit [Methanosalsum zhilinae DSM 4017]|uniref:Nickel import system ATP-binding protein NikD n=1 Tax=Methanosalsum zhilinae (strain DSM 4017 / NBRC 107636 / OCM 62 / WeN5) TaxID=679901 RepID=F7XNJ4_METZD|nr:ABC transporter ATP-binding protein [Methanosalsum zhilinae]AEH60091.1 oligopeptide/dipeptide ABC transporter, ATPase subunit [Methanosalsum zhilinae DSM 4017]
MLKLRDVKISFLSSEGLLAPVDSVDIDLKEKETFTIIGESGCGKSLIANSILGLLPKDAEISGRIYLEEEDLLSLPEKSLKKIRGRRVGMVFQNPSSSLNPVFTMRSQLAEIMKYSGMSPALQNMVDLMQKVGINDPLHRLAQYPHQLSGGLKQRFAVAFGTASDPDILIADEPTTGLDITLKMQLIDMLAQLHSQRSILLITHDLDVAYTLSDKIGVMYAGEIVEVAPVSSFFSKPLHPYSRKLIESHPLREMKPIPGNSPHIAERPQGCRFSSRCEHGDLCCCSTHPEMVQVDEDRFVRCLAYA